VIGRWFRDLSPWRLVDDRGGADQTSDVVEVSSFAVGLAGGRSLEVSVSGPQQGTPLVFHHGTPSERTQYPPFAEAAAARGLRLVTYSRPGYGGSARQPGRAVADCAADTLAIVDQLGAGRFYTAGWSGGGPHALACAVLLGDRVLACATIAGVGPFGAAGLDFLEGMGRDNQEEFGAALAGPSELQAYLEPKPRCWPG
jgi:pimeloyl-ACP methyl ester carboxylesterase